MFVQGAEVYIDHPMTRFDIYSEDVRVRDPHLSSAYATFDSYKALSTLVALSRGAGANSTRVTPSRSLPSSEVGVKVAVSPTNQGWNFQGQSISRSRVPSLISVLRGAAHLSR